jgi:hypothetical protein
MRTRAFSNNKPMKSGTLNNNFQNKFDDLIEVAKSNQRSKK